MSACLRTQEYLTRKGWTEVTQDVEACRTCKQPVNQHKSELNIRIRVSDDGPCGADVISLVDSGRLLTREDDIGQQYQICMICGHDAVKHDQNLLKFKRIGHEARRFCPYFFQISVFIIIVIVLTFGLLVYVPSPQNIAIAVIFFVGSMYGTVILLMDTDKTLDVERSLMCGRLLISCLTPLLVNINKGSKNWTHSNSYYTMRSSLLFLLLLLLVAVSAHDDIDEVYKRTRDTLDPDHESALEEAEYRLTVLERCEPYECQTQGDPGLARPSKAEIQWFQHVQKSVVTIRRSYPEYVDKVFCAIQDVFNDPQICQSHHASELVSKLNHLVQMDLASHDLVKKLNKRSK